MYPVLDFRIKGLYNQNLPNKTIDGIFSTLAGYGGKPEWIGDGFCDDLNNNEGCEFDGGDCCGVLMNKRFCSECECKGKLYKQCKIIHIVV